MNYDFKYADILANLLCDKDISDARVRNSAYEKARISLNRVVQKNNLIGTQTEAKMMRSLERAIGEFDREIVAQSNDKRFETEPKMSKIAEPEQVGMDEAELKTVGLRSNSPDFRRFFGRFSKVTGAGLAALLVVIGVGTVYFNFVIDRGEKVVETAPQLDDDFKELSGEALLAALRLKGRGKASLSDDGSVRIVSVRQDGATDRIARPIVLRYPRAASPAFKDKTVLATIRMRQEAVANNTPKSKTKVRITLSPGEIVGPVSKVFKVGADSEAFFVIALTTNGREDKAAVTLRFNTDMELPSNSSAMGGAILLESVKMDLY